MNVSGHKSVRQRQEENKPKIFSSTSSKPVLSHPIVLSKAASNSIRMHAMTVKMLVMKL